MAAIVGGFNAKNCENGSNSPGLRSKYLYTYLVKHILGINLILINNCFTELQKYGTMCNDN